MVNEKETNRQRNALKEAYSGDTWAKKVDAMAADQVAAVYFRLKNQNIIKI